MAKCELQASAKFKLDEASSGAKNTAAINIEPLCIRPHWVFCRFGFILGFIQFFFLCLSLCRRCAAHAVADKAAL